MDNEQNVDLLELLNRVINKKEFYRKLDELRQRVAENGSAMVKTEGQWAMKLGVEKPIDEILPVSERELAWRKKNKPAAI